jgi:hypothetical protein
MLPRMPSASAGPASIDTAKAAAKLAPILWIRAFIVGFPTDSPVQTNFAQFPGCAMKFRTYIGYRAHAVVPTQQPVE